MRAEKAVRKAVRDIRPRPDLSANVALDQELLVREEHRVSGNAQCTRKRSCRRQACTGHDSTREDGLPKTVVQLPVQRGDGIPIHLKAYQADGCRQLHECAPSASKDAKLVPSI